MLNKLKHNTEKKNSDILNVVQIKPGVSVKKNPSKDSLLTEFGKSRLLTRTELENLGFNLVIYPVTTQRLAMYGVEQGLKAIKETGNADAVLDMGYSLNSVCFGVARWPI